MKRPSVLSIAKFAPTVLCGLLAAAWIVSQFACLGVDIEWPNRGRNRRLHLAILAGDAYFSRWEGDGRPTAWFVRWRSEDDPQTWLGSIQSYGIPNEPTLLPMGVAIPIPLGLTLLFPLAVGCRRRFRFPLWSWFAFIGYAAIVIEARRVTAGVGTNGQRTARWAMLVLYAVGISLGVLIVVAVVTRFVSLSWLLKPLWPVSSSFPSLPFVGNLASKGSQSNSSYLHARIAHPWHP